MKTIIKIKTAIWALLISQGFYAQSPGGVSGTQLWYKANAGITQAGTVTQWNNSASASYNLVQQGAAATLPTYNAGAINFNPTVRFDGVDDRLYTPSVPQTVTTTASAPYATSQYIVFRKLGSVNSTFYSHSDGAGGTWNVGSAATGMIVTNRVISTTLPVANEIRLMNMDGDSGSAGLYVNGSSASTTLSNTVVPIGTQNFWVGAQGTTIFSNADIAEIVIYNSAQPSGRQQIESYLALKYGITKAGNYTSSGASFTVWNATTNTGYNNNIAGIGRDDNSALYQKQSMSINSGQQVLIGLNNMNDTNDTNTGTLADQKFLVWGDNGLGKTPTISIGGISDANARFASVWKVQNTNTVGTVRVMWPQGLTNLKLVQNASDPTFSTGNIVTNMTGTQIINGITYNYADVALADGQYFTFAALIQAPGGVVTNLQVWNRADFGTNTTTNAANVTTWNNSGFTGGQLQALSGFPSHTANPTYLVASTASNFNPSVRMIQGAGLGMLNAFSTNATTSGTGGTFYNVSKAGAGTSPTLGYNVQMNVSAATLSTAGSSTGEIGPYINSATSSGMFVFPANVTTTNFFNPSNTNILGLAYTTGTASTYPYKINGKNNAPSGSYTPSSFTGRNFHLNTDTDGGAERGGFDYQEVVGYERQLSVSEQNRVESYLAVKYGVTMDQATATNYVATDATVTWNASANSAYNQNITGIGRDDATALNQKQSQSINAGSQVAIGIGGALANTNLLNTNSFPTDRQYLIWGDNGLTKAPSVAISGITGVNYRFASVWKVQNSNLVGTVRVTWPQGLNNLKLVQNTTDPTFAAGNIVTDMSANTQTVNGIVYNYADVSLANGQYFTFAAYAQAPGGVVSNLRVWIKADDNPNGNTTDNVAISNWPNKGLIGGNFSGGAASPNTIALQTTGPLYRNSATMNINFNPVAQSTSTSGLGIQNAFVSTGDDYTMFALHKNPTVSGGFRNMFHFHGGANLNATSGSNEYFGSYFTQPIAWPSAAGTASYTANIPAVTTFSATGTGTISYQVNSLSKGSGGTLSKSGTDLLIGVDGDGGPDDGIDIIMPENIMYNSVLSTTDYNKVASYLAIKYGVTLGTSASPVNYTNTSAISIWSTAANAYQTNVIGIARDDAETLHQRISKSQDAVADIITISTNNDFTNANNSANHTDIANDQFYFMTGNDGAATTYNAQNIMLRRWKVQSTGTAQNLFFKTSDAQATYLIYADDAGMTTNVVNIPLTSGATAGIQIPNGKFFTFSKATFCTKDPNTAAADTFTKIGITIQTKQSGWPETIPNGAVALEGKTKGFVITRSQSALITNPIEGMVIYDTTDKCIKLYNGTSWNCVVRSCNQ